jgi:hypothetical protein
MLQGSRASCTKPSCKADSVSVSELLLRLDAGICVSSAALGKSLLHLLALAGTQVH